MSSSQLQGAPLAIRSPGCSPCPGIHRKSEVEDPNISGVSCYWWITWKHFVHIPKPRFHGEKNLVVLWMFSSKPNHKV